MVAQGTSNLANKKGHLDESSKTSGNKKTYSNRRPPYKKGQVDKVWENAKMAKERLKILIQENCCIGTKVNHVMVNGRWDILKLTSIVKNIKIIWMVK